MKVRVQILRYGATCGLIFLGCLGVGVGTMLMRQIHSPRDPLLGGIIAVVGIEIEAVSYRFVKNLRFEALFRTLLFVLFVFPVAAVLASSLVRVFAPQSLWRWGLTPLTVPQRVAYAIVVIAMAVNAIQLYRMAGLQWKAKRNLTIEENTL